MCVFGGGGASRDLANQQQQQADEARTDANTKAASLKTGMTNIDNAFGGFDDNYFDSLSTAYKNYAMPQLQDQYDQQKKNITYSLARTGNLNSTVKGDEQALLDKQNAQNTTSIESAGDAYANQARTQVQSNKQDVIGQLDASYDADQANASALSAAKSLATPPVFAPLGQLFQNVSALAAQSKLASDSNPYGYGTVGAKTYSGSQAASQVVP